MRVKSNKLLTEQQKLNESDAVAFQNFTEKSTFTTLSISTHRVPNKKVPVIEFSTTESLEPEMNCKLFVNCVIILIY